MSFGVCVWFPFSYCLTTLQYEPLELIQWLMVIRKCYVIFGGSKYQEKGWTYNPLRLLLMAIISFMFNVRMNSEEGQVLWNRGHMLKPKHQIDYLSELIQKWKGKKIGRDGRSWQYHSGHARRQEKRHAKTIMV